VRLATRMEEKGAAGDEIWIEIWGKERTLFYD
jgi:hypothetical protein